MEQSPPQDLMRGLPRAPVNPASLPPEYWTSLDSLYSNPELSHQHPPPPQQQQEHHTQQPQSQPLGIDWDHPIFNQQQHLPQQPSRSPLPPQPQDQSHGLYTSHTPQSWRGNTMQSQQMMPPTPQGFGISPQYRHVQPYPHGQVALDSRPLSTPDTPAYQQQTFSYPRNYYPPQHLSVPEAFHPASSPQAVPAQPTNGNSFPNDSAPTNINSFALPSGFPEDSMHAPIHFAHEFPDVTPNIPTHQTINPQFINAQQLNNQQHSSMNNFPYVNTSDFDRQGDPQMFDYFRNDLQLGSVMNQPTPNNVQPIAAKPPNLQVVVPINGHHAAVPRIPGQTVDVRKKAPSAKKQTKKAATKTQGKKVDGKGAVSSGSDSETDDSDLEIESPEEPSPIPLTRPTDPEAAAQYDTLQAVWSPRNRRPNVGKVKNALVAFKDVVKTVRDAWKEKTQAMKAAENKNDHDKAAQIKKVVVLQRRLMDVVVSTALDKGHPMIIEKLGEHPMAVAAIYSFLLDRHQAADIDGAFNTNLLKLLSRFITIDEEVLNKTNVAKLLPRFVKKGGPIVKELSQKILDNAAAATKRKQDSGKPSSKESSPSKPASDPVNGKRKETVGAKRPREGENNGQPATKRVVVASNSKNPLKSSSTVVNGPAKRPQELGQETKTTTASARPKANIIAPKPTNLFGTLSSASKRPGTTNAERAAAAAAAAKTSTPADKKEPQPRPTFSFGDIMADLNKQKEPAPVEPAEEKPPETEEEREKRLRKEARRKLRVSWKPDHSLTEVRFFTHDPDEELGPGDRSREAGDVKGEGSVLKLHRDLDDEDDEDGGIREENLLEYHELSEIDLEEINGRDKAFLKRGGIMEADSPEKTAQEHREATTLMVFYTSPADIPSTPKEPPPVEGEEPAPEIVSFGQLPDLVRARQERYFAMVNPKRAAPPQPAAPPATQPPSFDFSALFKAMHNVPQQNQPQNPTPPPISQPVSQASMSDLERTISMFRQQQPQPPQAPNPLAQMPQFPAMPQAPAIDLQKFLSAFNSQNQVPQPPLVPQAQQSQPSIPSNLAAIVSQLSAQSQQPPAASMPQASGGQYEDPERKRMRESGGGYDGADDDSYNNPPKRNKPGAPNKKHPKAGLVACRYWAEGRCRKGDDCTYRHDPLK